MQLRFGIPRIKAVDVTCPRPTIASLEALPTIAYFWQSVNDLLYAVLAVFLLLFGSIGAQCLLLPIPCVSYSDL